MKLIFTLFAIVFSNIVFSQNLLPDGSFESAANFNYTDPPGAFLFLNEWYSANSATPDLYDTNNPWPPSNPSSFWNVLSGTFDGTYYVGIANHFTYMGYTTPEAICSPLIEPLEANEYYYVELKSRNKGTVGYNGADPIFCVAENHEFLNILVDPDSIFVFIDIDNNNSYTEASKIVPIYAEELETKLPGTWGHYGTCFQANGDEKYLAVTTAMGNFSVNSPCLIYDDHWDSFYVYYYDLDDIRLTKLPREILLERDICEGRETKINIVEMAGLPSVMQNEIEYTWDDGKIDSVVFISESGTYDITVKTDCNIIPITLEVSGFKCDANVFVPNAFSPNGDGINDVLSAFISSDMKLVDFQFSVLDRWGGILFSTDDVSKKWDGLFKGKKMENGTYVWLLKYTVDDIENGPTSYSESGDVILFR